MNTAIISGSVAQTLKFYFTLGLDYLAQGSFQLFFRWRLPYDLYLCLFLHYSIISFNFITFTKILLISKIIFADSLSANSNGFDPVCNNNWLSKLSSFSFVIQHYWSRMYRLPIHFVYYIFRWLIYILRSLHLRSSVLRLQGNVY